MRSVQRIANHEISDSKYNSDSENNEIVAERSFEDGLVFLSFSGGGTRAASLAYGVLKELNESHYIKDNMQQRILDEVD